MDSQTLDRGPTRGLDGTFAITHIDPPQNTFADPQYTSDVKTSLLRCDLSHCMGKQRCDIPQHSVMSNNINDIMAFIITLQSPTSLQFYIANQQAERYMDQTAQSLRL